MHHDGAKCEGASAEGGVPFLFGELAGQKSLASRQGAWIGWLKKKGLNISLGSEGERDTKARRNRTKEGLGRRRQRKGGDGRRERENLDAKAVKVVARGVAWLCAE